MTMYHARHVQKTLLWHQRWFLLIVSALLISVFIGFGLLRHWQNSGRPDKNTYPVLGISLSQEDGYQDFHLLKNHGVGFVYLKATQGADYFDDKFLDNYWRIQGAQLPVGVYHYFSFTSSPQEQMQNFRDSVGAQIGTLPIVIQVNDYQKPRPARSKIKKSVLELQTLLVTTYQRKVIIQTAPVFADLFPNAAIWIQSARQPRQKSRLVFWEYDNQGKIPSLASTNLFHMSVFVGDQNHWQHFLQTGGY